MANSTSSRLTPIFADLNPSRPAGYSCRVLRQLLSVAVIATAVVTGGCQDASELSQDNKDQGSAQGSQPLEQGANSDNTTQDTTANRASDKELARNPARTSGERIEVDWSKIESGVTPINPSNFEYPFAQDSQSVTSYMDFFGVDKKTAQHNLTVGMASNEALSRVLDQLSTRYVSHELTDGQDIKLIIHTTDKVAPSRFDYVFADDFARGLSLPIIIQPDGDRSGKAANP